MPLFEEDPVHLSKSRLKSDLVAHNVALPPAKSRKEVYVELHLKHIDQKHAADFSSDEEEQVHDVEDKDEDPEETEIPDPSGLTDDELKAALLAHGVKVGPIVASTRALYEKKLRTLLQSNGHDHLNGTEKAELYSDSEEEEENGEEEEKECDYEEGKDETTEQSEQAPQESSQCFLPSPRLHARPSGNKEPAPKRNSGNALKSSERGQSHRSQIPAGISKASSVDQLSGLGSGVTSGLQSVKTSGCSSFPFQAFSITEMVEQMESRASFSSCPDTERALNGSNVHDHWSRSSRHDTMTPDEYNKKNKTVYYTPKTPPYKGEKKQPQGPAKDVFKDMFPDTPATPTGIYASRRRPIKGAAGRPIQYAYPDTPASPTTLQRRELERRLVPIQIQIAVFLAVACLLFLIYVFAEDDSLSSVVALLESLTQESDSEDGLLLQAESQEIPPLSGQE
ncbi:LEM domain-containing protein 1 isoform X2 [Cheilinus undulatus]|uniref:LEM domain-containing protein 1 isoform X2 n=1 Tax=Cheilinus undulatus TaxID=241271 RepID=UPI001BD3235A|nr:LEM domain-containing protein 1 isoform X2 [Cheilinus undulatus]